MKAKHYRYLEVLILVLLIVSLFLPWMLIRGMVKPYWCDYTLSAISIIKETMSLWSRTILEASIRTLSSFEILFVIDMTLCALLPFVALVLLVLTGIFTLLSGKSEKHVNRIRLLMKWIRICLISEAILVLAAYVSYSLCIGDLVFPAWGIVVALALLIPETVIRKKLTEQEKNERRRVGSHTRRYDSVSIIVHGGTGILACNGCIGSNERYNPVASFDVLDEIRIKDGITLYSCNGGTDFPGGSVAQILVKKAKTNVTAVTNSKNYFSKSGNICWGPNLFKGRWWEFCYFPDSVQRGPNRRVEK